MNAEDLVIILKKNMAKLSKSSAAAQSSRYATSSVPPCSTMQRELATKSSVAHVAVRSLSLKGQVQER